MSRDRRERDVICNIRMVLSITASMIHYCVHTAADQCRSEYYRQSADGWILVTAGYAIISVGVTCNISMVRNRAFCSCRQNKEKEDIPLWKHLKQPLPTGISLSLWG